MFRGFAIPVVEKAAGTTAAILISAALFMAVHGGVYSSGVDGLIFGAHLFIVGVMLGYAFKLTGSIWLVSGIHFGWNFLRAFVSEQSVHRAFIDKPFLVSASTVETAAGGGFESSVVSLIPVSVLAGVFWMLFRRKGARLVGGRAAGE